MPQLQLIATPAAHSEPAWSVAFNPKRNILASCSTDKTVRLYSYSLPGDDTGSPRAGNGHVHGPGCSHSHSPSSGHTSDPPTRAFAAPTSDRPVVNYVQTLQTEHKRTIRSLAWAPSGKTLATGSFDSTVAVWEETDAAGEDDDEEEEDEDVEGVYKPGVAKAAGGEDQDMEMDNDSGSKAKEWECVTTLEGHESECKAVGWSADGGLLASSSRDKSVWVWEVQPDSDFECIAVLMEHSQDVKTLAWHPSEEILASASYDSHIHLQWDDPDGDWCIFQKLHPKLPLTPLSIPRPGTTPAAAISSSAPSDSPTETPSTAASSAPSTVTPGQVASFNALVSALMPTPEEQQAETDLNVPPLLEDETIWSLAWSPCGKYLASGGDLGGIRIWARSGNNPDSPFFEIIHTAAHSRSCFTLSWTSAGTPSSEGGLGILASGGADGKIIIWQLSSPPSIPTAAEGESDVPQSHAVNVASKANTQSKPDIRITPVAAMRDAHGVADINCVAFLQREDGRGTGVLASCADDGSVKVWRVVGDRA